MAMIDSRPNIVVDENFIMLEKRLRRRYAERAAAYSNAEAIEQERSGARAFAIAPEAYGDSKFIGGISSFKHGTEGGIKYMTTEDYVAYFSRCHDTFGAMSLEKMAPETKRVVEAPKVVVNQKKIEQIHKIKAKEAAKARRQSARASVKPAPTANTATRTASAQRPAVNGARPTAQRPATTASTTQRAAKPASENIRIESSKLDAFFTKLSAVKGRALASVAAFAICCTFAIGGIVALNSGDEATTPAPAMERMSATDVVESVDGNAHANLLSTLE